MGQAATFVVFVAAVVGFTLVVARMWLRPTAVIERVTGTGARARRAYVPRHPSLVLHEMIARLGTLLPASPRDVSVITRQMIRAGIRSPGAVRKLYGAKVLLGLSVPLAVGPLLAQWETDPANQVAALGAAAAAGFFGPNEYIKRRIRRRQKQLRRGLPNALDLLVICVESGLGLDQAILQTAKELEHAHREISEELALVNLEMKAGKRRVEALRNLAERTGVQELGKLVAVLVQADRFGTGIGQTLRSHSDYLRVQARQKAEEQAAKLGVKLVFPIFFCILPSLFVVTVGPVMVKILLELLPMMTNM